MLMTLLPKYILEFFTSPFAFLFFFFINKTYVHSTLIMVITTNRLHLQIFVFKLICFFLLDILFINISVCNHINVWVFLANWALNVNYEKSIHKYLYIDFSYINNDIYIDNDGDRVVEIRISVHEIPGSKGGSQRDFSR